MTTDQTAEHAADVDVLDDEDTSAPILIEKNVPMPGRRREREYPFEGMEEGDMFRVTYEGNEKSFVSYLRNAASQYGKKHSMRFSIRKLDGNAYGCWRVKT